MRGCAQILIEHEARLPLHRGAKFSNRSRGERLTIKMCAHGAHTFVFHAPEWRASYTAGVLHAPKARFACAALFHVKQCFRQKNGFGKMFLRKKQKRLAFPSKA